MELRKQSMISPLIFVGLYSFCLEIVVPKLCLAFYHNKHEHRTKI